MKTIVRRAVSRWLQAITLVRTIGVGQPLWRDNFTWVFSIGHEEVDATVVIAGVEKRIQFLRGSLLHSAIKSQNVAAQAVNGVGPGSGGGRILVISSFHPDKRAHQA